MTDPRAAQYLLSEAESDRVFERRIVPQLLAGRASQDTPTVVVVLGQPGAGKSRVSAAVGTRLERRGGFVDVDSDLYKPYHPAYDALMAEDDRLMAVFTRADGRRWMARAQDYARQHRLNAIVQETSQDAAASAALIRSYREAGYRVEIMAMGVAKAMSDQGILHRYHEQVRDRGSGRLTAQANADQSYAGMLDLADLVDAAGLADEVAVFRRGEAAPRYANGLDAAGVWRSPPAFRAALETERTRSWTPTETVDFESVQQMLEAQMDPEWAPRLAEVRRSAGSLPWRDPGRPAQGTVRHPGPTPGDGDGDRAPRPVRSEDLVPGRRDGRPGQHHGTER